MDFVGALAQELSAQLARQGMNHTALIGLTGFKKSSVSSWLGGQVALPLHFVYSTCQVLGLEVGEVFGLAESRMGDGAPTAVGVGSEGSVATFSSAEVLRERGELFADCVAAELRSRLQTAGISVSRAGRESGCSPASAGRWLRGELVLPVRFVSGVGALLGVGIAELAQTAEARMRQFESAA